MALIRLIPAKRPVSELVGYVKNPEKTAGGTFVSAQNCDIWDAAERMNGTKVRFGQETNVTAFHLIHAFHEDEADPVRAQLLTREVMRRILPEYETVIATHLKEGEVHTHIVFNSVNGLSGRVFPYELKDFIRLFREESERIIRERDLPVRYDPSGKKRAYYLQFLKANGLLSTQEKTQLDAEECLSCSLSLPNFYDLMERLGYEITEGKNGPLFRLENAKKPCPLVRNGSVLSEDDLGKIISDNLNLPEPPPLPPEIPLPSRPERIDTLPELYRYWIELVRFVGKGGIPPFPSLRYREVSSLREYAIRSAFLTEHGVSTVKDLDRFQEELRQRLGDLSGEMKSLTRSVRKNRKRYDALDTLDRARTVSAEKPVPDPEDLLKLAKAQAVLIGTDPDALWQQRIETQQKRKALRAEYFRIRGQYRRACHIRKEIETIDRKAEYPFTGEGLERRKEPHEREQRRTDREDHERA